MNKSQKRIGFLVISSVSLVSVVTCVALIKTSFDIRADLQKHAKYQNAVGESYKYTYGLLDEDEMPIIGYVGPCDSKIAGTTSTHDVPMNANTYAEYVAVKESGINTVIPLSDNTVNDGSYEVFEALDNAERAGVTYLVHDPKFGDKVKDKDSLFDQMARYSSYKSFGGIVHADEPNMKQFKNYELTGSLMKQYFPDKIYYINLFPEFAYYAALTGEPVASDPTRHKEQWLEYINAFYYTYKPLYFSYDNYAFTNAAPELDHDWLGNLAICTEWCKNKGIPFFGFNLATAHLNYRQPTEGEFYWQVNTNLVYGAKGLQYFTYQTPNSFTQDDPEASFINKYGEKTKTYAMAQKIHTQIKNMDHVLMNCSHQQIIQVNNIPEGSNLSRSPGFSFVNNDIGTTKTQAWRELTSVTCSGDLLIGCMDYRGASVFYVVNNSITNDTTATLNFDPYVEANAYTMIDNSKVKGNSLTFDLKKGEAVCIEITNYNN